ncbi:MAG: DUF6949 family protein [Hyphomicrobiaceae bacterium]
MSQFAFVYGTLLGFALAGLAACAFEYVTDRRLEFDISADDSFLESLAGFLIRLVAGPYLVARFLYGIATSGQHLLLAGAGLVLVVIWSLASGILFISSFML